MWELVTLDPLLNKDVLPFVAHQIPGVRRASIGLPGGPSHRELDRFLHENGGALPPDIWIGARGVDGRLVGVVHASAHIGQAISAANTIRYPQGASPQWVVDYVRRCLHIEEIAVAPDLRRQGVGRALLTAAHNAAAHDPGRDLESVSAFAGSAEAIQLFGSLDYVIGAPRTPVPREYAYDLKTTWSSEYDDRVGSHVYRHWP